MKKIVKSIFAILLLSLAAVCLLSCQFNQNFANNGNQDLGIYEGFENYPNGKINPNGLLTLKNTANFSVLVFTDSIAPQNYIGTVPALSSINVSLSPNKFYNIVAVSKELYEKEKDLAYQSSTLAYYSNVQAYTISVSPENMTGSATWIFNNSTNYWVSVEKVDASGETYAVIAPNAKHVSVSVQTNKSYDYKVVYKKQLKHNGNIIAVSEKTSMEENDTATFLNLTQFTTDLKGGATHDNSDVAPTVQFINNTGKTLRVYNGQYQLSDAGIYSDDYTLATGVTAFFANFTDGTSLTSLGVRSVAWNDNIKCNNTTQLKNGNVYIVTVTSNDSNSTNPNLTWTVETKTANEFYTD